MRFLRNTISNLENAGKQVIILNLSTDIFGLWVTCVAPARHYETLQMLEYYHNNGFHRIAAAGFRKDSVNDIARRSVMLSNVVSGYALPEDAIFFWLDDLDECLESFSDRAGDFDAVICPNGPFGICLLNHLRNRGIRVPEDIMVSSFSDMLISRLITPSVTSMTQDYYSVGVHAFYIWQLLSAHKDSKATFSVKVPSKLTVRESTAGLPESNTSINRVFPEIKAGDSFVEDPFYDNPQISRLFRLENCLSGCDGIDRKIISCIFNGMPYESISEFLHLSISSVRYRVGKIYKGAGVVNQADFLTVYRQIIGERNPFSDVDITNDGV